MRRTTLRALGIVLGLAVAAAATAVGATAGSDAKAPYRVMFITVVGAPTGDNSDAVAATQAAAAAINKAGGLKGGVPIQVHFCNDNNTPTGAVDCARQAVQGNYDDVMVSNSFTPSTNPILDAAGIPQIASFPVSPQDYFDKNIVPVDAPTVSYYSGGLLYLVKSQHLKRVAIVTLQLASTLTIAAGQKAAIRALGGTYVGTTTVPLTQTDFLPIVQQLKAQSPDIVLTSLTGGQSIALDKAAQQLGLNAQFTGAATVVKDNILQQMPNGGAGWWLGAPYPPYTTNLPGLKTFISQMTAGGYTDATKYYSAIAIRFWLNTWALQKLSLHTKGAVTKTSMRAASRKAKGIKLFGLTTWNPSAKGPAAYPNSPNGLIYVNKAVNGQAVLVTKKPLNFFKLTKLER